MAANLLTIGQFARRCGLTAKALRHYDRLGLLLPSAVDPRNGYRLYAAEQAATARLIGLLRSVDLPLDEVRRCLGAADDDVRRILAVHRRRLEARSTRIRGALHTLDHLVADERSLTMPDPQPVSGDERRLAVDLFNGVWQLLEKEDRSTAEDHRMLHMAHASRFHWENVGTAVNLARGEWQCSRVYAVLGRAEPALHHARRVLQLCGDNGIGDWDLAFGYEALARAQAVGGDAEQARAATEQALAVAEDIAEQDDRALVLADLETIPGQPRFW